MASILTGSIVADIRGSVGTEAYSRNAYGPYVKSRVTPANPNTVPQQNARAVITAAVAAWQALTDLQRKAYVQAASDRNLVNRLGLKTRITGYNLFVRQFQLADRHGAADPTYITAPSLNGTYQLRSIDADSSTFDIHVTNPSLISTAKITVYATPPRSPGQMSFNPSTSRVLAVTTTSNGDQTIDLKTEYEAIFGALSGFSGNRLTVGINTSIVESGELTTTLFKSELIAA